VSTAACSSALFVYVFCLRLTSGIIQLGGVEVKRLVTVVTLAVLLVGLILFGLTDLNISVADTSIPDNKITTSQTKASNSSAIALIMIAWTTPSGEGGSNEL
jgi:hypothetical protein